ncbi:MAG: glutamate--tRNA ligase [Acidimicrobiia bacterium]
MSTVPRVRFAPAPTGSLHVGSAHTALFNWLYVRHHGGTLILRIEDTDVARSRDDWVDAIGESLSWLGLDWDEGPVRQSARLDSYVEAAQRLVAAGRAYECYCTGDEVQARNEEARAAGRTPGYDGRCRDLSDADRERLAGEGRERSVRFRTPDEGRSTFHDLVRGEVSVEWSTVPDFVILRSDGSPVFFLANAVDDADMGITHVIRGEDLIDSTHRIRALFSALGDVEPPQYAHLPLILGADKAKLSKRHGAVALEDFRAQGILPEAMFNYLALLGWTTDDDSEVMGRDEIVRTFDLDGVTQAPAVFDPKKLEWMNGEYIRALPLDDLVERLRPDAQGRFGAAFDDETFRAAVAIGQERAVTTAALLDQMSFLFVRDDDFVVADESWDRLAATERVGDILDAVITYIRDCDWTVEALDLREVLAELDVKPRKAMPALYAAVEGRHAGLPLFDSLHLLGRETVLARLRAARARLEQ